LAESVVTANVLGDTLWCGRVRVGCDLTLNAETMTCDVMPKTNTMTCDLMRAAQTMTCELGGLRSFPTEKGNTSETLSL
jgi:hypothetical protein